MKTLILLVALLGAYQVGDDSDPAANALRKGGTMDLGAFSVSLAVQDIAKSRAFYEALGFEQIGGNQSQNWLVLRNGTTTIGIFQGMFEGIMLTFNPGWVSSGEHPEEFTDIREIQRRLHEQGLELTTQADESSEGPASLTLLDPDGYVILLDQHR